AALTTAPSGAPRRSLTRWRLVPSLPRLVGSGPVSGPPRGGRHRRAIGRLPVPPDPVLRVVAPELVGPKPLPDPLRHPLLEALVAGRARAEARRHRLPLDAGPQDVEDPVEDLPKRDDRPTGRPRGLLRREQGLARRPQVVGDLPDGRLGGRIIMAHHRRAPP